MTIGIYALFWEKESLVYIGQSRNIEKRYKDHLKTMESGKHANYKILNAYSKYGLPELVVLEICNSKDLYYLETLWTREFDSIKNGLNIVEPGPTGWGVNSSQSKYSLIQVLKVFSLLSRSTLAQIDIAKKVKVSLRLVEAIKGGYSHTWLKESYPERYQAMKTRQSTKNTVARANGKGFTLVNKDTWEEVEVYSVVDFTKSLFGRDITSFSSGIRRIIRGEQHTFKNWVSKAIASSLKENHTKTVI